MILNDIDIRERIAFSKLVEIPGKSYSKCYRYYDYAIQPASYDLRLSSTFRSIKALRWLNTDKRYVDIDDKVEYAETVSDDFVVQPGEFVLGMSQEIVHLPADLAAMLSPRSSFGRAGLSLSFSTWLNPDSSIYTPVESKSVSVLLPAYLPGSALVWALAAVIPSVAKARKIASLFIVFINSFQTAKIRTFSDMAKKIFLNEIILIYFVYLYIFLYLLYCSKFNLSSFLCILWFRIKFFIQFLIFIIIFTWATE